jgi:post-segregation antitoxin (ccd killing protein)
MAGKMKIRGNKATVSITLHPELVEKSRKYGLNISKITENALKDAISRMESPKNETRVEKPVFGEAFSAEKGSVEPSAGFGPATITLPR